MSEQEVVPASALYLDLDNYSLCRHCVEKRLSALHLADRQTVVFDADSVASGRIAVYH